MSKEIAELVAEFLKGDDRAFAEIVRRFQRKIYSLAFQMLGNHLDADEVVQETFVRVYNKRKELHDVKYFTSFILRIATNYSIDLIRKRKFQSGVTDDTTKLPGNIQLDLSKSVSTPSQELERKQLMSEIREALDMLPPKQRITAILHDVEGYSKSDIAEALNCPEATVRSNLHIARNKLKKILSQRRKGVKNDM